MAFQNAELEAGEGLFAAAHELLAPLDTHAAAVVSARLAQIELSTGRAEQARSRLEAAFAAVVGDEPDEDVVEVAARLGSVLALDGADDQAREPTEFALRLSQALRLPQQLVRALGTKAGIARASDRPEEAVALQRHALRLALEHDLTEQAALLTSTCPTTPLGVTAIPRRSTPSRTASSSPAGSALGSGSCSSSPRRATPLQWAIASALALDETGAAVRLLSTIEELQPGLRPPFLEAQAHRLRARMND